MNCSAKNCRRFMLQSGLTFVAQVMQEHIQNMKKEDLSAQQSSLVNFFSQALDLRNTRQLKVRNPTMLTNVAIASPEKSITDTNCQYCVVVFNVAFFFSFATAVLG